MDVEKVGSSVSGKWGPNKASEQTCLRWGTVGFSFGFRHSLIHPVYCVRPQKLNQVSMCTPVTGMCDSRDNGHACIQGSPLGSECTR